MRLRNPRQLKLGKLYRIAEGEGEGYIGACIEIHESAFGHVWAKLARKGEERIVRWRLLEYYYTVDGTPEGSTSNPSLDM